MLWGIPKQDLVYEVSHNIKGLIKVISWNQWRFIYTSDGKDGSRRGCCSGKTFDLEGHLGCCEGRKLMPHGECLGELTEHQQAVKI